MILIGRNLSPFVRRSATLMHMAGLSFEQQVITTDDVEALSHFNPLLRVPALQLDDEEVLIDSHAIIDYILSEYDLDHRLCPGPGAARREVMRISAIAVGVMEKMLACAYERNQRPAEKVHTPYIDKVLAQAVNGLNVLETLAEGVNFYGGNAPNLADVNAVVAYDFAMIVAPHMVEECALNHLPALVARAGEQPAFANTRWQG